MPDMTKPAYVRMRGTEWTLKPEDAARLERAGMIWRDYDCEDNTVANGYPDEGPCYGVTGESEGDEEARNAARLDELAIDTLEEHD